MRLEAATGGASIYPVRRYTLGGFYLARYTDSPVGAFDEVCAAARQRHASAHDGAKNGHSAVIFKALTVSCLQLVAVAGLVWNFPGSCAWAARVYVSDKCAASTTPSCIQLPPHH